MLKLNLTATINTQRPDKNNKCQVRIRSTIKRKVTYFSTGISVLPEQFENGEIIKHPNRNLLNAEIRQRIAEIEKEYLEGNGIIHVQKKVDFYTFSKNKIEQQKKTLAPGTYIHKKSFLKKVHEFKPFLLLNDINNSFMLDFENHCKGKNNKDTTIWGNIKFIKAMLNAAIVDGVIKENPLKKFKQKAYVSPQRHFLTESEIESIEKFYLKSDSELLKKVSNWFLFGCYTGLRYEDVRNFDKKRIVNGRIILRTGKYKTDVSIKLHPKLNDAIERFNYDVISNNKMNLYLKIIAERCEIKKNIGFHTSRHTFAVYFLTKGGTMETLSKLLGHSKLQTTLIYGKIINVRVDNEMDAIWAEK